MRQMAQFMTVVSLLACPVFAAHAATASLDAPRINKNGIQVWTYQTSNNPVMHYRAITRVNSSLNRVAAAILDTDYLSQWVPYTAQVDVLAKDEQQGSFSLRMQLDFPFPLSDRDVVVSGQISQNKDGSVRIQNRAVSDPRAPVQPDVVRIVRYEGGWTLRPINAQETEVSTEGYADPAGNIPLSVANFFAEQQPYQMLQALKTVVQLPRYQHAKAPVFRAAPTP